MKTYRFSRFTRQLGGKEIYHETNLNNLVEQTRNPVRANLSPETHTADVVRLKGEKAKAVKEYESAKDIFGEDSPQTIELKNAATTAAKKLTYTKGRLGWILPGGVFSAHGAKNLKSFSGLVFIDLDSKDNPTIDFPDFKAHIHDKLQGVMLVKTSPSGDGLHILVAVEPIPKTPKEYEQARKQVYEQLPKGTVYDKNAGAYSQVMFQSYDPECIYTPDAKPFPVQYAEDKPVKRNERKDESTVRFRNVDALASDMVAKKKIMIIGPRGAKDVRVWDPVAGRYSDAIDDWLNELNYRGMKYAEGRLEYSMGSGDDIKWVKYNANTTTTKVGKDIGVCLRSLAVVPDEQLNRNPYLFAFRDGTVIDCRTMDTRRQRPEDRLTNFMKHNIPVVSDKLPKAKIDKAKKIWNILETQSFGPKGNPVRDYWDAWLGATALGIRMRRAIGLFGASDAAKSTIFEQFEKHIGPPFVYKPSHEALSYKKWDDEASKFLCFAIRNSRLVFIDELHSMKIIDSSTFNAILTAETMEARAKGSRDITVNLKCNFALTANSPRFPGNDETIYKAMKKRMAVVDFKDSIKDPDMAFTQPIDEVPGIMTEVWIQKAHEFHKRYGLSIPIPPKEMIDPLDTFKESDGVDDFINAHFTLGDTTDPEQMFNHASFIKMYRYFLTEVEGQKSISRGEMKAIKKNIDSALREAGFKLNARKTSGYFYVGGVLLTGLGMELFTNAVDNPDKAWYRKHDSTASEHGFLH